MKDTQKYGITQEQRDQNLEKLRELCRIAKPHKSYGQREIARFIGVSHEAVAKWERSALRKMRKRLESHEYKELGMELKELIAPR